MPSISSSFVVEISSNKADFGLELSAVAARKARNAAVGTPERVKDVEDPLSAPEEADSQSTLRYFEGEEAKSPYHDTPALPAAATEEATDDTLPPAKRRKRDITREAKCVSRFTPKPGINMARILDRDTSAVTGIMLGLDPAEMSSEIILVFGVYRVKVLRGTLSVGTAVLEPSDPPLDVVAPSTHPLPPLFAIESASPSSPLDVQDINLEPAPSKDSFLQSCVFKLEPLSNGITEIEGIARRGNLIKRNTEMWKRKQPAAVNAWECYHHETGSGFEVVLEPLNAAQGLQKNHTWDTALRELTAADATQSRVCVMIQGAKQSGKSTFARLCLNALLRGYAQVAFLNLDPGQTEFTPPGLLSLHVFSAPVVAPSFSRLHQPLSSHFLGSSTPLQDPDYYLQAIAALYHAYEGIDQESASSTRDHTTIPLIVNTCGWVKGKGSELLQQISGLVSPTHHYNMSNAALSNNTSLIRLEPCSTDSTATRLSPAVLRDLSILSYLHFNERAQTWDFRTPLSARLSAICNWTTALFKIYITHTSLSYEHVLYALNASIVALVHLDDAVERLAGLPYRQEDEINRPDPQHSRCVGLALVRSIDPNTTSVALLSPLSFEDIQQVNCLCLGQIELPVVAMYEDNVGPQRSLLPYLRTDDFAGGKKHIRRNVQRREHQFDSRA